MVRIPELFLKYFLSSVELTIHDDISFCSVAFKDGFKFIFGEGLKIAAMLTNCGIYDVMPA